MQINPSFDNFQTEAALTYDAVYAFAHGMNDLSRATAAQLRPSNVSCGDGLSWAEGTSLFNLISMVDYYGLTGERLPASSTNLPSGKAGK